MISADGIGPQRSRAAMAAVGALLLLTGACASPFEEAGAGGRRASARGR